MESEIRMDRGCTHARTLTYMKDGVVASLVGCNVYFTAKTSEFDSDFTDASASIKKDYLNLAGEDAENGRVIIIIEPNDTKELNPAIEYHFDIRVNDHGNVYKLDEGTITLDGSTTNRA